MFGFFKRETRARSSDAEILTLRDIESLIKQLGPESAGEVIREKAISGHKLCQSFLSASAIHMADSKKLPPDARAKAKRDAEHFTRLAAENGDMEAQFNLSLILFRKIDASSGCISEEHIGYIREAKHWADKSAVQGFKPASDALKNLEPLRRFF
jgi:TPR repeat protein